MKEAKILLIRIRSGLTLLELLMVLVILAIVATVSIQSLQPQVDNQRFQTATRLLSEIEAAAIGPRQKFQTDGTPLISGFVADTGRLPLPSSGGIQSGFTSLAPESATSLETNTSATPTGAPNLAELWSEHSALATQFPFQFRDGPTEPVDYSDIRLACGWRGPYLQLPPGSTQVIDPWGNSPQVLLNQAGEISHIQIKVPSQKDTVQPLMLSKDLVRGRVQVTGNVIVDDVENSTIRVVILIPDPRLSLTTLVVLENESPQSGSFLFSNVPIGLRAVIAEVNGIHHVKYVQVPLGGTSVVFDLQSTN
jgi:prepilin-type N-terminal cleavage/methylation domain-containing protein